MSEQTKIVPVICRDCKETMTILATASAIIIEGRCPACSKKFKEKGIEHNKSIGYSNGFKITATQEPAAKEPVSDVEMHNLSTNGVYGLEFILFGETSDRVIRLLKDGIRFCDNLKETEESKLIKEALQEILTAYQPLVDESEKGYFKGEKSKDMLASHLPKYNEKEICRIQQFLNEQGTSYFQRYIAKIKRKRRGCFF
ncbi:MAG: hypothetical protein PHW62_00380 [Candidatus Ratteibacteria bacterium]|nr:hypothetical protein [Candidatus Ratteibacteria bacterium]